MISMEKASHLLLRIGLAFLFLYYGISKMILPQKPAVPAKLLFYIPLTENSIIYIIAVIEIIIAVFLLMGLFTRTISLISGLFILFNIIFISGFSLESLGDFIAVCVSISLAMSGPGGFAVDNLIKNRKPHNKKEGYLNYDL